MRAFSRFGTLVIGLGLLAAPAAAQDRSGSGDPSGVRDSARFLDELPDAGVRARALDAPRPKVTWLVLPSFVSTDGLRIAGGTFGVIAKSLPRPVQVRFAVRRQAFAEGDDRTQIGIDAKSALLSASSSKLTVLGEAKRTLETSRKLKAGVAFEHTIAQKLTFGAEVDYLNSKRAGADKGTGDLAPAVGVSYAWTDALETSFDYAFENDVDGDSDFSFTIAHVLVPPPANGRRGPAVLVFGAGKGRTIFATMILSFNR
jgi:hypothetical protein